MKFPRKIKVIVLTVVALFVAFFFLQSIGYFDDAPYRAVPHGNHYHYVPVDRDPNVPLDAFPTVPPRPGERILPNGQIVRE